MAPVLCPTAGAVSRPLERSYTPHVKILPARIEVDWIAQSTTLHNIASSLKGVKGVAVVRPRPCNQACQEGKAPPLITVSAAGLNASGDKALLWGQYSCGNDCGNPYFVMLRKEGRTWKVVNLQHLGIH